MMCFEKTCVYHNSKTFSCVAKDKNVKPIMGKNCLKYKEKEVKIVNEQYK